MPTPFTISGPHNENRSKHICLCGNYVVWSNTHGSGELRVAYRQDLSLPAGEIFPFTLHVGGVPGALASDGRFVYYNDLSTGAIMRVDTFVLETVHPTVFAIGQGRVTQMAVDGTTLYWVSNTNGTLNSLALSGTSAPTQRATGLQFPYGLAVDPTYIYWSLDTPATGAGSVYKMTKVGSVTTIVVSNRNGARSLAVDGAGHVFWVEEAGGVYQINSDGTGQITLTTLNTVGRVATDGTNVFCVDRGTFAGSYADGSLHEIPVGGGTDTPLATALLDPFGVAFGPGAYLYFTSEGTDERSGTVFAVTH
jgi:hypothetical protein